MSSPVTTTNESFTRVRDLNVKVTDLESLVQQQSKPVVLPFDLTAAAFSQNIPLQGFLLNAASPQGVVLKITDGGFIQRLTLNKSAGAANNTVHKQIQNILGHTAVGDATVLKFVSGSADIAGAGSVAIGSDAAMVGTPLGLFSNAAGEQSGVALVAVRSTNVTAGSEEVSLRVLHNGPFV